MNRIFFAVAVLSLASAAFGEEAQPKQDPQPQAQAEAQPPSVDVTALEGRVTSLEEQLAEAKGTLAGLAKIKWSGYMQARFAYQECVSGKASTGCSYNAYWNASTPPTTGPDKDNFFIRRGRLKIVYDADLAQFVLQLDAIPSGVSVKEAYATVKLPRGLSVDAGLQLMPFGYDVGVRSSADLDLLERYLGAGQWLKGEYDVGVAIRGAYGHFNFRGGVFNGNGVDASQGRDNDNYKDLIGRVGFDYGMITGGVSGWYGKTKNWAAAPDKTYDRKRLGADAQVYLDLLPFGGTALKGEFIIGTTAIGGTAAGGTDLGVTGHAWHATLTQNVGKTFQVAGRWQSYVKNNNLVATTETVKEVRQLDLAVHAFVGGNYKLTGLYSHPMDGEKIGTGGTLAGSVKKTDQFVLQAQAKF